MHKTNSLTIALSLTVLVAVSVAAPPDSAKSTVVVPAATVPDTAKAIHVAKDSSGNPPVAPVAIDSAKSPAAAPVSAIAGADSVASDSVVADTTKAGPAKKRKRIVRETTVNTIDELKGRYRSPKKAMFMSLLVPGLGQTYVGGHWANYTRGAFYFLTDVALAYGWHYYVVNRQDQQIAKYRKFADKEWRQSRYEVFLSNHITPFDQEKFDVVNAHRQSYCESVQNRETAKGSTLYSGCLHPNETNYQAFQVEYDDAAWSTDSVSVRRGQFVNSHAFYELIGKEVEFITGWSDAGNIDLGDSAYYIKDTDGITPLKGADGKVLPATTDKQQEYIFMRAKANDYARMQAYFLGGMVINHLVSALDAALTAHYHNKALYQTEVRWWDRVHLDGGFAWQGIQPGTAVTASVTF